MSNSHSGGFAQEGMSLSVMMEILNFHNFLFGRLSPVAPTSELSAWQHAMLSPTVEIAGFAGSSMVEQ
jgi:hypothetical protein